MPSQPACTAVAGRTSGHWTCRNDSNIQQTYSVIRSRCVTALMRSQGVAAVRLAWNLRRNCAQPINQMRAFRYLHFILWSALFAVFVWISAPIVGPAIRENRVGALETNRSIDAYLGALTGVEHGSEKLPDVFRRLGKDGSLIIFVRDENAQSEFLGMMIGYISWPREVQIIKVASPSVEKELVGIKPSSVAGVVFCSVDPPAWLQHRVPLGSGIILVPVTEAAP